MNELTEAPSFMLSCVWFVIGLSMIVLTLSDGFSFILMSRKRENRNGFSMWIERIYWRIFRFVLLRTKRLQIRERLFAMYAPMVILTLLIAWATSLIYGFALLSWSFGEEWKGSIHEPRFADYVYLSGVTFFTLGYGDLSPAENFGKIFSLIEVGCGYSFLAAIVGFIPTIASIYSERELGLLRIEMQTGENFSATGALYRMIPSRDMANINVFFRECNDWLLKLHLSQVCYPVLCYQRYSSQSVNWLKGVSVLLDLSAISLAWMELEDDRAVSNLYQHGIRTLQQFNDLFWLDPASEPRSTRVSREKCLRLWDNLHQMGFPMRPLEDPVAAIEQYLGKYELQLSALSDYLVMPLAEMTADEIQPLTR
ncbi:MAG: two pore domain potassium channel family protein [Planctomycetota bacterium]|nr:MAG: two pore domain potassium channel family protein [Planctomycetota bacterium]